MTAQLIALILGAAGFGWLLPEFVVVLSVRNVRIPMGMNYLCALSAAAVAFGLAS